MSLFDGISCGMLALKKAGFKVKKYYASEIKKDAIRVSQYNFPEIVRLGDVTKIDFKKFKDIDLLIGGSPCQDFSQAHSERLGLEGNKSSLFWEYMRAKKELNPKYFLLENVVMTDENYEILSTHLGTYPQNINSSIFSAQLRERLYWFNFGRRQIDLFGFPTCDIPIPPPKNIKLQDILTSGYADRLKARCLLESDSRPLVSKTNMIKRYRDTGFTTLVFEDKDNDFSCRYLNQTELERCQTLPEGYTKILNRNAAAGVIGDGWTVDVIAHIFGELKKEMGYDNQSNGTQTL